GLPRQRAPARRALRSFPTRRSSDLRSPLIRLDPEPRFGVEEVQARGVGSDTDGVAATDRRASSHSRHEIPLTALHIRPTVDVGRSEEHTSELQSRFDLVCRLLLEKK